MSYSNVRDFALQLSPLPSIDTLSSVFYFCTILVQSRYRFLFEAIKALLIKFAQSLNTRVRELGELLLPHEGTVVKSNVNTAVT